jgi:hypothetical protein
MQELQFRFQKRRTEQGFHIERLGGHSTEGNLDGAVEAMGCLPTFLRIRDNRHAHSIQRRMPPQMSHGPDKDACVNDVLESEAKSLKRDSLNGATGRGSHCASFDLKFKLGRARLFAPRRLCGFSFSHVEVDGDSCNSSLPLYETNPTRNQNPEPEPPEAADQT